MEIVTVASSRPVMVVSLLQLLTRTFNEQCTLMLSLEVVHPSGNLSMGFSCGIMAKLQLESVLAGDCGDCSDCSR
jgi:hypothetical protein